MGIMGILWVTGKWDESHENSSKIPLFPRELFPNYSWNIQDKRMEISGLGFFWECTGGIQEQNSQLFLGFSK